MKTFLLLGILILSLSVMAQRPPMTGTLGYIKNQSVVLENLQTRRSQTVGNSSGVRWFAFTGTRLVLWREAGIFVSFPPYQTAVPSSINAQFLEGIASVGEKLFLAYRRPNSQVLVYQTHVLTTMQSQVSPFFPETSNRDGSVLAYRIGSRVRVLRGNLAQTALEYPQTEALNWGVSMPALSPDGKSILFAHNNGSGFLESGQSQWRLQLRNLETRQEKTLFVHMARIPDGISVSPDGTRALVSYAQDKKNILEIVNLELGFTRILHQNFLEGVAGSWSPDGQSVLAENIAGNASEVFIKDPNGQTLQTIFGAQMAQWLP